VNGIKLVDIVLSWSIGMVFLFTCDRITLDQDSSSFRFFTLNLKVIPFRNERSGISPEHFMDLQKEHIRNYRLKSVALGI
jgi:hypothetical protein